jgi:uncharacterized protein
MSMRSVGVHADVAGATTWTPTLRLAKTARMDATYAQILVVALTFVAAGIVKGLIGMGLPTVAMGLLGSLMTPAEAVAYLVIPSLVTNVWQFLAGENRLALFRRTWPMLLAILVVTWASAGLIAGKNAGHSATWLGAALILYAIIGLAKVRLFVPRSWETWLSPAIGAATGLVTGATGVFVIPAVPYLQALAFDKDDLVQVLGLAFTASTIALAAGLASRGAFQTADAGASTLCTAPALAGMALGQIIRARVAAPMFQRIFFIGLAGLGAELLIRTAF